MLEPRQKARLHTRRRLGAATVGASPSPLHSKFSSQISPFVAVVVAASSRSAPLTRRYRDQRAQVTTRRHERVGVTRDLPCCASSSSSSSTPFFVLSFSTASERQCRNVSCLINFMIISLQLVGQHRPFGRNNDSLHLSSMGSSTRPPSKHLIVSNSVCHSGQLQGRPKCKGNSLGLLVKKTSGGDWMRSRLDCRGGDGGQSSQAHTQRGSGLMSRHNSSSSNRSSATRITTPVDDTRHKRSSSNSGLDSTSSPQEPDYSNFFKPAAEDTNIVPGFQTGSSMFKTASIDVTSKMPETPVLMGFHESIEAGFGSASDTFQSGFGSSCEKVESLGRGRFVVIQTGAASSANAPEVSLARPILASVLNSPGRKSTQATSSKSFSTPIRSNNPRAFNHHF